ncbi:MAG: phage tail protein [Rhizobiaceae bacterium]|nr:phage tail protein [Rhizobiaceae bacterium]
MVKTPRTRHSKTEREPVTIELGPGEMSRVEPAGDEEAQADISAEPEAASAGPQDDHGLGQPDNTDEKIAAGSAETSPAEDPKPAPHETAWNDSLSSSASAQKRPSRAPVFGAGLVGGIVALATAGLLQYAGVLGTPGTAGGQAAPAVPEALSSEIASLKSEIEALKSGAAAPVDVSGVTNQIDGLSQALEQVKADVSGLRDAVANGGAGDGAAVETLNAKITEIESRIAAIGTGSDGASAQEIASINERIASIEALAGSAREADTDFAGRIGALEQSVSALGTKVDAQAGQPKIAMAIAAAALKSAIDRGSPFLSEIETFAAIAPGATGLTELRTYAEKGVATRADLVAETDVAAKAMIAAANPPPVDAGFFERLLSSAESLVSVRPIGAVEGPGVPETVARMEVAVKAGDLSKAIAEYETLPEVAKSAGAAFADKIKARLAVENLADQAIAAAMQA